MNRYIKRAGLIVLAGALLCLPLNTYATNSEIQDSKKKIEENKKKMEEVKKQKYAVEAKLSELEALKKDAAEYIAKLDKELSELDSQIAGLNADMAKKEEEIEITKQELSVAKENEISQYNSMKSRIKHMYERGKTSYLSDLFESGSFSEILNKAEYIQRVSEYDRKKLDEYEQIKLEIETKEEQLNSEYEELDALKAAAEDRQQGVEKLQNDKQQELNSYQQKMNEANEDISELQGDIVGIKAAIQAEENNIAAIEAELKRKEEEARKKAEDKGEKYETKSLGDISFIWPLPSSSRITSKFGDRESPTEGASSNHKGVDIGAPKGSPIIAAAAGDVVIATYSASAGNYVMINHGGGVYTVYMHMNSISCKVGDSIEKGGSVGTVGSTGYSTGPHLHFGIRNNGTYIDPLKYVSP
ncbi:MAG: peptidoglycan DD-metalloendopeptidase family protein [Eubacteriales bacterium]|nr:peptidoglycan DD-metalloendopeptidase family protein [Eubacteriales bacterium]